SSCRLRSTGRWSATGPRRGRSRCSGTGRPRSRPRRSCAPALRECAPPRSGSAARSRAALSGLESTSLGFYLLKGGAENILGAPDDRVLPRLGLAVLAVGVGGIGFGADLGTKRRRPGRTDGDRQLERASQRGGRALLDLGARLLGQVDVPLALERQRQLARRQRHDLGVRQQRRQSGSFRLE